jgi:shikimate kinase
MGPGFESQPDHQHYPGSDYFVFGIFFTIHFRVHLYISNMAKLNHRIFLIGMMGAGKSYRAQKLSAYFEFPWYDTDVMIEQEAGKTINEIFTEEGGEEHFRRMEHELLVRYPWPEGCIVSCGGGMPCFHNNVEKMLELGLVVWLNPDIAMLTERLWKETSHRPMVLHSSTREALEERLTELYKVRLPFFKRADIEIKGNPSSKDFNGIILAALA